MNQVKSWDSNVEHAIEFPTSFPPVDENIIPHLCLDPALRTQVSFKSVTMLYSPYHFQPF